MIPNGISIYESAQWATGSLFIDKGVVDHVSNTNPHKPYGNKYSGRRTHNLVSWAAARDPRPRDVGPITRGAQCSAAGAPERLLSRLRTTVIPGPARSRDPDYTRDSKCNTFGLLGPSKPRGGGRETWGKFPFSQGSPATFSTTSDFWAWNCHKSYQLCINFFLPWNRVATSTGDEVISPTM